MSDEPLVRERVIGSTGTFRGKRRRNGRACGRHYLWSAICATRSKGTRGPAVGYGPHRTIYHAGQTGIDAIGKVAEGFRAQGTQGADAFASPGVEVD